MNENLPSAVNAEIVAIGTELLLGEITDTNSVYLARQLRDLGINLFFMTSVGDNEARITEAIQHSLSRAEIVITCGGLGPTIDDMTRQGVAAATGRGLAYHAELLEAIGARFASFRAVMTENNARQAYVPEGAIIVENPVGTAPSFIVEQGNQCVISLPGVPREMKFLFETRIAGYLREHYHLGGSIIKARVLKTAGVGESALDAIIGPELLTASNPTVGLAAHSGQVDVRITAKAASGEEADALIAAAEAQLNGRIGRWVFGADADTLDSALIKALREAGVLVHLLEAGVDPVLSERARLISEAGLQITAERLADEQAARASLGLPASLSLREMAEAEARQMARSDHELAVAVVSLADDTGDQADSTERTALAVCYRGEVRSRSYGFGGRAPETRQFITTWAWGMAWRLLRDAAG